MKLHVSNSRHSRKFHWAVFLGDEVIIREIKSRKVAKKYKKDLEALLDSAEHDWNKRFSFWNAQQGKDNYVLMVTPSKQKESKITRCTFFKFRRESAHNDFRIKFRNLIKKAQKEGKRKDRRIGGENRV